MKAKDLVLGRKYAVKVSGHVVPVRLYRKGERFTAARPNGMDYWEGINCLTGRQVKILSAQRCRYEIQDESSLLDSPTNAS
jgi:hypothetical protein